MHPINHKGLLNLKYCLLLVLFSVVLLLFYRVANAHDFPWDQTIMSWIQGSEAINLVSSVKILSMFGTYSGMIACYTFLLLLTFWLKGLAAVAFIAIVSLAQIGLIEILKLTIRRPRPFLLGEDGFDSFPSGQTFYALIYFTLVWFVLSPYLTRVSFRAGFLFICLSATVSVGTLRIHSGEHWPSDVLGSWLIGLLAVSLVLLVLNRVNNYLK